MNFSLQAAKHTKIGTCPHGLPMGACPICSGSGGGGGSKKVNSAPQSEMSWDECFAVGQMMKAQKLAQQQREAALQNPAFLNANINSNIEKFVQNISSFTEKIANFAAKTSNLPAIISKPIAFVANNLLVPMLNIIKNLPMNFQKITSFIQEKMADISDKLNAVFGELKNSIEKKISDRLKDFKKKFKSIFGVFEPLDTDDEEQKIEDEKRIFEFKTISENIKNFINKQKENNDYAEN